VASCVSVSLMQIPEAISLKRGEACLGYSDSDGRIQCMVSWSHCFWTYSEEAHPGGSKDPSPHGKREPRAHSSFQVNGPNAKKHLSPNS
jgi:hypothetical protein